jgi:anti-sigma B factor antagonist
VEFDDARPTSPFGATIAFDAGIVELNGELDADCAVALAAVLDQAISVSAEVVLDLRGVSFIDSTALRTLLDTWRRIAPLGGSITTRHARPNVARLLDITGTNRIISLDEPAAPA